MGRFVQSYLNKSNIWSLFNQYFYSKRFIRMFYLRYIADMIHLSSFLILIFKIRKSMNVVGRIFNFAIFSYFFVIRNFLQIQRNISCGKLLKKNAATIELLVWYYRYSYCAIGICFYTLYHTITLWWKYFT